VGEGRKGREAHGGGGEEAMGREREGGGEGEDRKVEGNINFGYIPQNSSKQRSMPSLCSTVADTRSHTCTVFMQIKQKIQFSSRNSIHSKRHKLHLLSLVQLLCLLLVQLLWLLLVQLFPNCTRIHVITYVYK